MQITFLGTSCMQPTKERNQVAAFLSYRSEGILVDCGEGTQRQMKIAGIPIPKITKILISHWHGDHVLGLAGLLQTYASVETRKTIHVYGPKGTKKNYEAMFAGILLEGRLNVQVHEVAEGIFFENDRFKLEAAPLEHPAPCTGYVFQEKDRRHIKMQAIRRMGIPEGPKLGELQKGKAIKWNNKEVQPEDVSTRLKGKKISFITDTRLTQNCYKLAEDADILIIEGTFTNKFKDKASAHGHLTAAESAQIAAKANVKKLVLTHFSARYKNTIDIEEEARTIFNNIICAQDFMKIII